MTGTPLVYSIAIDPNRPVCALWENQVVSRWKNRGTKEHVGLTELKLI